MERLPTPSHDLPKQTFHVKNSTPLIALFYTKIHKFRMQRSSNMTYNFWTNILAVQPTCNFQWTSNDGPRRKLRDFAWLKPLKFSGGGRLSSISFFPHLGIWQFVIEIIHIYYLKKNVNNGYYGEDAMRWLQSPPPWEFQR